MWTIKEQKDKIYRILELAGEGFNIPRFFFLEQDPSLGRIDQCLAWAYEINKKEPSQVFNIRTYNYGNKQESCQTEHIVDLSYDDLQKILHNFSNKYNCMVDAETPDNGRLAGNAIIHTDKITGRSKTFTLEWCIKPLRAMVRDANKSFTGPYDSIHMENMKIPIITGDIITKAKKFWRKDVILEWTYFCKPAGIKKENLVWWEYRKA